MERYDKILPIPVLGPKRVYDDALGQEQRRTGLPLDTLRELHPYCPSADHLRGMHFTAVILLHECPDDDVARARAIAAGYGAKVLGWGAL